MRSTEHSTDLKVGAFAMLPTAQSGIIDIKNHSARIALHRIVTAAGQNERHYDTASDKIQSAGR